MSGGGSSSRPAPVENLLAYITRRRRGIEYCIIIEIIETGRAPDLVPTFSAFWFPLHFVGMVTERARTFFRLERGGGW